MMHHYKQEDGDWKWMVGANLMLIGTILLSALYLVNAVTILIPFSDFPNSFQAN